MTQNYTKHRLEFSSRKRYTSRTRDERLTLIQIAWYLNPIFSLCEKTTATEIRLKLRFESLLQREKWTPIRSVRPNSISISLQWNQYTQTFFYYTHFFVHLMCYLYFTIVKFRAQLNQRISVTVLQLKMKNIFRNLYA